MKWSTGPMIILFALVPAPLPSEAVTNVLRKNPIRKVVNMLQMMSKKVEEEGKKELELFEKYMCYCKSSGGTLGKSIADAENKIPDLQSSIKEAVSAKDQLTGDVAEHKKDRADAKEAMASATSIREKDAAAYAAESSELSANIKALKTAIASMQKGMAGFLQTGSAAVLKKLILAKQDMMDDDRQQILSFLSGGSESEDSASYVPASGGATDGAGSEEITGILKQMLDEMSKSLAEATATEEAAIKAYDALMAAKKKEVDALSKMIEEKLTRIGESSVTIETMKNDLVDTEEALAEDKKFMADLKTNCATKKKDWDAQVQMRQQELQALAETIKVLNDDDALELFKKTLPSLAQQSFIQIEETGASVGARALAFIQEASSRAHRPDLDLISLALRGKKVGFEKVMTLIDGMVVTLKKEQTGDDDKKEYCATEFDTSEDKQKEITQAIDDLETSITKTSEAIATTTDEVQALVDSIKALDTAVKEATEQRKKEHEDFTTLMAQNTAAKEVILFAKNRLNKFYNPKMYTAPKRELSAEDRIVSNMGGTLAPTVAGGIADTGISVSFAQVSMHRTDEEDEDGVAPPPPPESFDAYQKKSEESGGVLALMDMLVQDLEKEMTVGKAEEKDSQEEYETFMKDSADKRAEDSKAITNKEAAIAQLEEELQNSKDAKASNTNELTALKKYIMTLHSECDWLIKFFEPRKEARANEVDSLVKAKAVLSGADYSMIQISRHTRLRLR